jgi:chemotaxis protein methyltransferase CheR
MTSKLNSAGPTGLDPTGAFSQLSDEDYVFICNLVYERSRIHLGKDKKVLVTSRLIKRLRALKIPDYREYCEYLRSSAGEEELTMLIDRISTNHTHFYREMKHFDFLRETFLPAWKARTTGKNEPLRVWSAASSTGEEPYTIAIHLADNLAGPESGAWQIDATDISTRVLEVAKQGVYETDRLAGISPEMLRHYFQKGTGEWAGHFRIKDSMRQRVTFHHVNLLEPNYPFSKPFQIIFCRNVMIYFDRPTQEQLVNYLSQRLVPGGYLFVGHSESLSGVKHNLKLVQPAIYLKP